MFRILHLATFILPSSLLLSSLLPPPSPPHSHLPSSISLTTCFIFRLPTPCPFVLFLSLSFQHLLITPCLPVLTLTTYHSVPCDSVSHFLHSSYYPICCITPSPVVYKSFQLVAISLACNCHCSCVSYHSLFLLINLPLTIQSPCVSPACLCQN